jgi:hypothetical protein
MTRPIVNIRIKELDDSPEAFIFTVYLRYLVSHTVRFLCVVWSSSILFFLEK